MTRAALVLILLACLCAECTPLMLVLVAAAGICTFIRKPYKECPHCGAALDWGERCDCRTESEQRESKEKAVQGATNTRDGKAEQKSSELLCSASQFI